MTARLLLRLTVASWRAAPWRLALSALGVAVAVLVLLGAMAVNPALDRQRDRVARRQQPVAAPGQNAPLLWAADGNEHPSAVGDINVVAVAALGPDAPVPLGAPRHLQPGEVLVSPALRRALATREGAILGHRLPGPVVGELGKEVLGDPRELVMMIGVAPAAMGPASEIRRFSMEPPPAPALGVSTRPRQLLTMVAGTALLLPVLAFVHGSLLVAGRRREERLAALRLVGGTAGQIRWLAVTESVLGGLLGAGIGFAAAAALRGLANEPSIAGFHFFAADLAPPAGNVAAVLVGLPLLSALVGRSMTRAVEASPLGVRRAARRSRTSGIARAAVAFGVGWALLLAGAVLSDGIGITALGLFVAAGFALVALGFLGLAPALLTAVLSLVGRVARGAGGVLALRRLRSDAAGAARAVGGIAVAALVGATALVYFPSQIAASAERDVAGPQPASADVDVYTNGRLDLVQVLRDVPTVRDAVPVGGDGLTSVAFASCDRVLQAMRSTDECQPGLAYAAPAAAGRPGAPAAVLPALGRVYPTIDYVVPTAPPPHSEVMRWLVATDGSREAVEHVRRALLRAAPDVQVASRTNEGPEPPSRHELDKRKLDLATAFVFAVGAARFLLALVEGIVVRRRELAMLIAQGTDTAVLRRAAMLEFAIPMVALAATGAAVGAAVATTVLATAGIPPAVPTGDVALAIAALVVLGTVCAAVASVGIGRSFDIRALAGERA